MGAIENEHIYGLQIRESANDGSDFTNPDPDYRILFVGEDGLFHLRDSAGTVTTPSQGALADPMTTRGDMIVRNASNATARLARGSADTYLGSDGTDLAFSSVTDAKLSTSDVTTNNASTSKHGFLKKLSNVSTEYMDGTGAWSTPAGGGGGSGAALGAIAYDSGSTAVWHSTASATVSDIDATNAKLDITVPASGAIVVMIQGDFWTSVAGGTGRLLVRTGTTNLAARSIPQVALASGPPPGGGNHQSTGGGMWFYITGLTPGALTIKAGYAASGAGGSTLNVYAHDGAATHSGPFVMVAFAA